MNLFLLENGIDCQPGNHLNIAIGLSHSDLAHWFSDAKLPLPEEIRPLLDIINPNAILSGKKKAFFLKEKGMKIDLGALAKGYIADRIADFLKAEKVTQRPINLGGNVLTFGPAQHNPDQKWRTGIQNPKETRNTNLMVLAIRDQSVVTSGIYERTFEIDGKTYHHIFDSQTGYPVSSDLASLTIISSLSVDGEIWTTRLFGSSLEHIFQEVSSQELSLKQSSLIKIITAFRQVAFTKCEFLKNSKKTCQVDHLLIN